MIELAQNLLHSDRGTATFALAYFSAFGILAILSIVYAFIVPPREKDAEGGVKPVPEMTRRAASTASGFARWIASLPITPNQITLIGLLLVAFNCAYFLYHRDTFIFGAGLIVAYLFDTLDGIVARAQGTSSLFGGYLDAVVDRYQEVFTFLAIGLVLDNWLVVFLVLSGSLLVSYNKARTAVEVPIDNKGWREALAKPMRLFILCVGLIGYASLPWLLPLSLWSLAFMTHFTALQRVARAWFLISGFGGSAGEANG